MPITNVNYSPLHSKWGIFDQPCQLTVTLSIDRQICKSTKNRPVTSKNRPQVTVTHLGRSFKSLGAFLGVAAIINGVVTLQLTAIFPTTSRNFPYSQQKFSQHLAGIPPTASRSLPYSQQEFPLQLAAVFPTASRNSPYCQQQFSLQLAGIPLQLASVFPAASRNSPTTSSSFPCSQQEFPYSQQEFSLQLASTSTASQYFLQLQLASTFYSYSQLEFTDSQHSLQLAAAFYSRQQEAVSCGILEHSSAINRGHS